jgi:ABC-type nitrate/sulfonate/bicarbonate transport system substrate-binding protein
MTIFQTETRSIWYTRCPVPTALGLAVRIGYLQKDLAARGLSFESIQQSGDRSKQQSHFTHTLENSIRHGGNTPAIYARANGADTRIVALSWTQTPHPILALPGSGITSAADLKGKRLALSLRKNDPIDFWRAAALRAYEAALAHAGLSLSDVTLVDLPVERTYLDDGRLLSKPGGAHRLATGGDLQREEVFALIRGEVDAIYSQSSYASEVVNFTGAVVIHDVGTQPNEIDKANNAMPEAFTISAGLIERDPEAVSLILAHSIAAADWARAHPGQARRIIASEQRVAEETLQSAYGDALAAELDIDLSDFRVAALANRKDFLLRHKFIVDDFDLQGWIDTRPLKRANEIVAAWKKSGAAAKSQEWEVA